jgi:hypothetical protein
LRFNRAERGQMATLRRAKPDPAANPARIASLSPMITSPDV